MFLIEALSPPGIRWSQWHQPFTEHFASVGWSSKKTTAQERLALTEETANRREVAEGILAQLQQMSGLADLPFDEKRRLLVLLVDEIILDSREQWFEIRGELNGRFSYTSGEVVLTSVPRSQHKRTTRIPYSFCFSYTLNGELFVPQA